MFIGKRAIYCENYPSMEIDDTQAVFRAQEFLAATGGRRCSAQLGDIYDHPELYKNYPELKSLTVLLEPSSSEQLPFEACFSVGHHRIEVIVPETMNGSTDQDAINERLHQHIAHEVQHAVQAIEGMPAGSIPEMWRNAAWIQEEESPEHRRKMAQSAEYVEAVSQMIRRSAGVLKDVGLDHFAEYMKSNVEQAQQTLGRSKDYDAIDKHIKEIERAIGARSFDLYMQDQGELQARVTGAKAIRNPHEELTSANSRELLGAPTTNWRHTRCMARFAMERFIHQLKEIAAPKKLSKGLLEIGEGALNKIKASYKIDAGIENTLGAKDIHSTWCSLKGILKRGEERLQLRRSKASAPSPYDRSSR